MNTLRQLCIGCLFGVAFVGLQLATAASAESSEKPPFLPEYYAPLLVDNGQPLPYLNHVLKETGDFYRYQAKDHSATLEIDRVQCRRSNCINVFGNILAVVNQQPDIVKLTFEDMDNRDARATIFRAETVSTMFVFRMPSSVHIFIYEITAAAYAKDREAILRFNKKFQQARAFANRNRYEQALAGGNVMMGLWTDSIRSYALALLDSEKKSDAVSVLQRLVATTPFDFEGHLALMQNAEDPGTARTSAEVILKHAEDFDLHTKAAAFLGSPPMAIDTIPYLDKDASGLQLILIPLGPIDLDLLADAAKIYERITGVPTKLRRLPIEWEPGKPDRPFLIVNNEIIDFGGQSTERFMTQLRSSFPNHARSEYIISAFEKGLDASTGQYYADRLLDLFMRHIGQYGSNKKPVMYVGVTSDNLYLGTARYVFSVSVIKPTARGSILSYEMLKAFGNNTPSRQRLTERLAKELVPASLKSLEIPRPTDPTDPYSYSNGMARVDGKTLKLSPPVAEALDKFRPPKAGQDSGTEDP